MKLWIKYLFASALGYLFAAFIPFFLDQIEWVYSASEVISLIVPWILFPLVFFTLAPAVAFVREKQQLLRLSARALLWAFLSHIMLVALGALIASQVIASPSIPGILPEGITLPNFPGALRLQHLPFWLILLCSAVFGLALQPSHESHSQGYRTMQALGEACFRITRGISEFLAVGVFILAGILVHEITESLSAVEDSILLLIIILSSLIGVFLVLPLLSLVLCPQKHPFRWIVSLAAPYISAAVSGNYLLASIPLYSTARTNLGTAKPVPSMSLPLFAVFARGGTSMITAILSISIVSFYQGTPPGIIQVLLLSALSIAASLTVFTAPGMELSLSVMLVLTASGIDLSTAAGFSVVSILLSGAAASLDIMIGGMGTGYVAQILGAEKVPAWKQMQ